MLTRRQKILQLLDKPRQSNFKQTRGSPPNQASGSQDAKIISPPDNTRRAIYETSEGTTIAERDIALAADSGIIHRKTNKHSKEFQSSSNQNSLDSIKESITFKLANKVCGKRVRDKGHACYFCHKIIVNNLARHLEQVHSEELEVSRILAMPKSSKSRRDAFVQITRCGDFYHNCEVLTTQVGELILTRRPTPQESAVLKYSDYGPCPDCLGFMIKQHMWYHLKYACLSKRTKDFLSENNDQRGAICESTALLKGILGNISSEFITNIMNKFRNDDISDIIRHDITIINFGAFLYEKHSTTQTELIRQSMRQLGRLLQQLQKHFNTSIKSIQDALAPEKFDEVVNATKALCVVSKEVAKRPEFQTPSLALKLGYALRKCATIERGQALRKGDFAKNKKLVSFLTLLDIEWQVRISSNALQTLHIRKDSSVTELVVVDKRESHQFTGRKLEDINIEDLPRLGNDNEDDVSDDEVQPGPSSNKDSSKVGEQLTDSSDSKPKPNTSTYPKKAFALRKKWSPEEKQAVLHHFKMNIRKHILPGKSECVECIEQHDVLQTRKWTDLKFFIKNEITKIKRIIK